MSSNLYQPRTVLVALLLLHEKSMQHDPSLSLSSSYAMEAAAYISQICKIDIMNFSHFFDRQDAIEPWQGAHVIYYNANGFSMREIVKALNQEVEENSGGSWRISKVYNNAGTLSITISLRNIASPWE